MIIDKKGKLFGRINILDILIVLILIVAVYFAGAGFLSRISGGKVTVKNTMEVIYTVEVTKQTSEYFDKISPGNIVFHTNSKEPGGTVIECQLKPAVYEVENKENMTFENAEVDGMYDGYIKIKATADVNYPDLTLDSEAIKIGKFVSYRTESVIMKGHITAIEYDHDELRGHKNDN